MGIKSSKIKLNNLEITDYNFIKIPSGYELVKIISYECELYNTVNLNKQIKNTFDILISNNKNKTVDICCLQGINDYKSAYKLIKYIKQYAYEKNISFYFSPNFDDVNHTSITNEKLSKDGNSYNIDNIKKKIVQNIIISRYPIITTIYTELDDNVEIDNILGTRILTGANISIYGNIISIYNISLHKNINSANIRNDNVRLKELESVFGAIENNKKNLKNKVFKHFFSTDIHLLVGNFNIYEKNGEELNYEYVELIKKYHIVDIYRHCNNENDGYTTLSNQRINYIFFLLLEEVYKNKRFLKIESSKELINFIFKTYNFLILDSTIINNSNNFFPIEFVFMIFKNNH